MIPLLENLLAAGHLGDIDLHFAKAMARIGGESNPQVLLACALVSHQVSRAHVCFEVAKATPKTFEIPDHMLPLPPGEEWLSVLRDSPLVSDGSKLRPLVLDASGLLYLRRYWKHEQVLAQYIQSAATVNEEVDGAKLKEGLDRLFPASGDSEPDYQRLAALMAVRRRFSVVSGGPGTGKTYTVVKILALLIEQALSKPADTPPHITLVAPTGKAAARLVESIKKAKSEIDCEAEVKDAIVDRASTVHRCLRSIGGSGTVFRHNVDNRLATDVMLVDEASMVNIGLMRRLVDALPPHARLILLGDMDQLASVEAGAVLGDICNTGRTRYFSKALREDVANLIGDVVPIDDSESPDETGIWDCVAKLTKSYRFKDDSGIAALAKAINDDKPEQALSAIKQFKELSLVAQGKPGTLSNTLIENVVAGYSAYLKPGLTPIERLRAFDSFRVLCPRRTGPFGAVAINELITIALHKAGIINAEEENYQGRPILITANDYDLDLFNGDVGLILNDSETRAKRAYFIAADGSERTFAPSRLSSVQTVYAMSVHKSQGSEFDNIEIALPDYISPVMTREILYTAVTRAKRGVTIHGSEDILTKTIRQKAERTSGLRAALWSGG